MIENLDGTYARYIDEFNVEIAPTNYENISNFNLNPELMIQYGFYPITIVNPEEVLKWPVIRYDEDKVNKRIFGTRINKEPLPDEYRPVVFERAKDLYIQYLAREVIYVDNIAYDRNLYEVSKLTAMILTGEDYYFMALDEKEYLLNTDKITKFLKDKLYIENRFEQAYKKIQIQIAEAKTTKELDEINLEEYPIIYFKITELHDNIRDEEILNESSGTLLTVMNIGAFFSEETRVYYGEQGFNGKEYLDEHHIPYIKLSHPMGPIVGLQGDLNLDINFKIHNDQPVTEEVVRDSLIALGINAYLDNNDIMVDGKKCCGCTTLMKWVWHEYQTSYIHISFNVDRELIDIVRVKPKVKEPIGLKEVLPTITREVLLKEIETQLIKRGYRNTK